MRAFNNISWDLSLPSFLFVFRILSDSIWTKVEKTIGKYCFIKSWVSSFFAQLLCGKQCPNTDFLELP